MVHTIVFGIAGAIIAAYLGYGIILGSAFGVVVSQYMQLNDRVKQLQRRLAILESPGAPQQRPAQASRVQAQPAAAVAAPVAATPQPATMPPQIDAVGNSEPITPPPRPATAQQAAAARRNKQPGALQQWLERFSTTTRIGIVVLFIGVSFLFKYAADHGVFPIEVRLLGVLALGAGIYQIGRKLQPKERNYGLLLRGAGIGIWYLSCYAASSLYHLIGQNLSLAFLIALSAFTAWNAVRHNTRAMAIFGMVGGFLAPILLATGEGNHTILFTYYAVVNAGIVAIAWRQTWRELPAIGFVFTFVIGAFWGATSYRPEFFATTEPFLLLSAAFYLAVPLLFANQVKRGKLPLYSNLIVFGTPAVTFALQLQLVANFHNGDTWSALLFGTTYTAVLLSLWKKLGANAPLLRDAMLGIAVVFFTLAIAFAFDQQVAGALWAIEAAGGVWLSVRQQRKWGCYLCLLILLGSGGLWLYDFPSAGERLLLNAASLQIALIALAGLFIALILDAQPRVLSQRWVTLTAGWAVAWWLGGGVWQIADHLPADQQLNAFGMYILCSSAALLGLVLLSSRRLAGYLGEYSLQLLSVLGLLATFQPDGPLTGLGSVLWPAAICYLYFANYRLSSNPKLKSLSVVTYWFAAATTLAISSAEFHRFFTARYPTIAGGVIALTLPLLIAFWLLPRLRLWRIEFADLHKQAINGAVLLLLMLCFAAGLPIPPGIETGAGTLIAWPLNVLQIVVLVSVALWWRRYEPAKPLEFSRNQGWMLLGACAFLLANAVLLRFIHLHQHIAFDAQALFKNDVVQTSLSVLWTMVGVVAVMWASRHEHSTLWHLGMGLLAVVVAKLFLVDLSQSGTVERIVSFIAVGLLLMAVGWKSPRPQRAAAGTAAHANAPGPIG